MINTPLYICVVVLPTHNAGIFKNIIIITLLVEVLMYRNYIKY